MKLIEALLSKLGADPILVDERLLEALKGENFW